MSTYKTYFCISKNTNHQTFIDFIKNSRLSINPQISNIFSPKEAALSDMIFVDKKTAIQQCSALLNIKKESSYFLPVLLLASENLNEEKSFPTCIDDVIFKPFSQTEWKNRLQTYLRLREKEKKLFCQEEDKFKTLFTESHSIMLLIDPETGKIEDANRTACNFYGYSHSKLTQMKIQQINQLSDDRVKQEMENARANKKNYFVFEHRLADGSIRTVEVYSGKVTHQKKPLLYSIIHDITETKKTEKLLLESEENYRKIIDNAPDIVALFDKNGTILFVNQRITEYSNYSPEEIIGKPVTDFLPPEDHQKALEAIKRVYNNSQEPPFFSSSLLLQDGRKVPFISKGILLKYKGRMVNMTIIRDISFIKEAENKLKESKETLQNIFNNSSVAIYVQDKEGRFLDINKAALKQYGYADKNDLIGKTPEFVAAEGKNNLAEIKRQLEQAFKGTPQHFEFWAKRSDGSLFPKLVIVEKGTYFGQPVLFNFSFDISDRKRMEEALRESEAKYHNLFHYMKNCVVVYAIDENGDIIIKDLNRAAEKLEKVNRKEVKGKKLEDVFPGVKDFGIYQAIEKVYETEKPMNLPVKFYKDNRITGWRENYLYKLPTGEIVAIYDDVTQQKKAEDQLKESVENYRLLFEKSPFGIFIVKPDGTILDANPVLLKILGSPSLEATKKINVLHFKPLIDAGFVRYFNDCIETGSIVRFKTSYASKWGKTFVAESTFVPLKDNNGNIQKIYIILRDITKQYRAEQLLKESEEKYHSIFQTSSDAISITEFPSGKYIEVNDRLKEILGYSSEEILGKTPAELGIWANIEDRKKSVKTLEEKGFIKDLGVRFKSKNGRLIYGLLSAQLINLRGKQYVVSETRDITHLKQAEEELRKSQQLFKTLANISPTGIFRTDTKGKATYVNPKWSEITGYSFEEAREDGWTNILHPDEKKELEVKWEKNITNQTFSKEKFRILRPDGTVRWVLGNAIPEKVNGKLVGFVGTITDITDMVKTEQALRESENKYRSLAETSSDLILTFDLNGKLTYLSPSVERITGFSASEVLRKNFWEFIAPEYIESTKAKFKKGINGERIPLYEIELIHKNKKRVPIELNVTSLLDADGKPIGRLAVARDITERKKAEKALKESEARLKRFSQITKEGIIIHKNGIAIDVNQAILQMLGYSTEELIGKDIIKKLVKPEYYQTINENIKKKYAEPYDIEIFKKDGTLLPVEVSGINYTDINGETSRAVVIRDITQRRKMEKALRESENKYRSLAEASIDMILTYDLEGRITYVNPVVEKIFGYTPKEIIGTKFTNYIPPEHVEQARLSFNRGKLGNTHPLYELEIIHKSGKKITVELNPTSIFDTEGKIIGRLTIVRDVTVRKKAEKALKESEKKYKEKSHLFRLMSDNVPNLVWAKDLQGRFIFVNKALCEKLLFSKDIKEPIGKTTMFFVNRQRKLHPERKNWFTFGEVCIKSDAVVLKNKKAQHFEEYGYVHGKFLFLDVYKAPIFDENNKIIGTVGHARDITKEKEAEKELLLRDKALNAAANAIIITNADGKIEWINKAFTKLSGYTKKEALGILTTDLIGSGKQDESFYENLNNTLRSGQVWKGEFTDKRKDGTLYEVEEVITPVTDKYGKVEHLIGIMTDISERKAAERELRAAKEAAEESSRLKSAFLANMNHEIRTPMNAIMGFSELMLDATPEEKENYAVIVNKSAGQLLNLIDDVIFLSRLQSEKLPVKEITFYPADLVREIFLMFDLPEMKNNLELKLQLPNKAETIAMQADAYKIRQVLTNFTSNAIKYTKDGFVKLGFETHDNNIIFFVEDSGIGIPEEEQQHIFEAFYRGSVATNSAIRGTGLGLNIAKELVELMGGTVGVSSQLGKGSIFHFSLPYKPPEAISSKENSHTPEPKKWEELNILIVEDIETNYLYLEVLLRGKVNRIDRASNGQEAIEMVRKNAYDLILMDLKMPVLSGYEATREIKKLYPHLPVIAITAYATQEEKDRALEAGCDGYLSKPIKKADITALINKYVSNENESISNG